MNRRDLTWAALALGLLVGRCDAPTHVHASPDSERRVVQALERIARALERR
jgi:hypothetical protein